MTFAELLAPVADGQSLAPDRAGDLMRYLVSGEASEAQIGGALMALRVKGVTSTELAAFARVLREAVTAVEHDHPHVVDTCGTGGGAPSFNISTASAIVAAAAGVKLAKHGNRAVTSTCGSADVLEALGVVLASDPAELRAKLDLHGIVFLFAPHHHPGMRHVGKARKELGIRTVFNQLGPLANPARARRQLVGVYDPNLLLSMGEALNELGTERAFLAHGRDGLDEISPCVPTDVVKVWEGEVTRIVLTPPLFGIEPLPAAAIQPGATLEENAAILTEAISRVDSPRFAAILPSTAVTLLIAGQAESLADAADLARQTVRDGLAAAKLRELAA